MGIKLLIATHNPAKLRELTEFLKTLLNPQIKIYSLFDLKITTDPEETGKTFAENSLLKAKYYAQLSQIPTLSDDGGLSIDGLKGEPGVKSRRWPGYEATDEELILYALKRVAQIPKSKRTAVMSTVLTFYDPHTNFFLSETAGIRGHIIDTAKQINPNWARGYAYRAIFIVDKYGKYYDNLTEKEHNTINHRRIILKRLASKINKHLLQ